MKLLSFIMPVKNAEPFIADAVNGLRSQSYQDWELIIVDDGSTDGTYAQATALSENDKRIRIVRNPSKGKVRALNFGYSLSKGSHIKCIDGDDVLMPSFSDEIDRLLSYDASYHDFEIVDRGRKRIGSAKMGRTMVDIGFIECFIRMKSLPRCLWSFDRKLADLIFPMPDDLPFEDVWFSLMIKKYAERIGYIARPLYEYRQHEGQTFGGYLNYSKDVLIFRAKRMLKLFKVIEKDGQRLTGDLADARSMLGPSSDYYGLMAQEDLSIGTIVRSGLDLKQKVRLVLFRKLSVLMPLASKLWEMIK